MSKHHSGDEAMLELKREFREKCEAEDAPCWMDGLPVDYTIPPDQAWRDDAFQLDHYFPVSKHPELERDVGNFRASHAQCNRDKGDGPPRPALGVLSEAWF